MLMETNNNSFKTKNTTIIGNLISGENNQFYVEFVVDGKSTIVLVNKNSNINPSDIPSISKEGYNFDGWFDEDNKLFNPKKSVTRNLILNAKFTKVSDLSSVKSEEKNPDTSDINLYLLLSLIAVSGCGISYTIKKRFN